MITSFFIVLYIIALTIYDFIIRKYHKPSLKELKTLEKFGFALAIIMIINTLSIIWN